MPVNPTKEINSDQTVTYNINQSDTGYHFAAGILIEAPNYGIVELDTLFGNTLTIDGFISSNIGIQSYGYESGITIGQNGAVFGKFIGIQQGGNNQTLTNHGVILSKIFGIYLDNGNNRQVDNFGTISADYGLAGWSNSLTLNNHAGASIYANTYAIFTDTASAAGWEINNAGTIKGGGSAITLDNSADNIITNTGTITGDVILGSGNDQFDTSNGTFGGNFFAGAGNDIITARNSDLMVNFNLGVGDDTIDLRGATGSISAYGNAGDDFYFVSGKNQGLFESLNEGTDSVKATASFTLAANLENLALLGKANRNATGNELDNILTGNNGKNTIKGMAGDDTISGGKGNDKLIGGTGADVFVFANKGGHDKIMDFDAGTDSIDLSGLSAITSFSDLKQHHMSAANGDVIITAGKDQLILDGVKIGDLHKGDFDF